MAERADGTGAEAGAPAPARYVKAVLYLGKGSAVLFLGAQRWGGRLRIYVQIWAIDQLLRDLIVRMCSTPSDGLVVIVLTGV